MTRKTWAAILGIVMSLDGLLALATSHLTVSGGITSLFLMVGAVAALRGGDGRYLLVPLGMSLALSLLPLQIPLSGIQFLSASKALIFYVLVLGQLAIELVAIGLLAVPEAKKIGAL